MVKEQRDLGRLISGERHASIAHMKRRVVSNENVDLEVNGQTDRKIARKVLYLL